MAASDRPQPADIGAPAFNGSVLLPTSSNTPAPPGAVPDPKEGLVRMRTTATVAVSLALAGTLVACTKSTDQTATAASGGPCKIALLLPENATPRYEAADKPYFEAEV